MLTGAMPSAATAGSRPGKGGGTPDSEAAPASCRGAGGSRTAAGAAAAAAPVARTPAAGGTASGSADDACCSNLADLLLRLPAPGAMSRSVPPSVQYRWQACRREGHGSGVPGVQAPGRPHPHATQGRAGRRAGLTSGKQVGAGLQGCCLLPAADG